MIAQQGRTLTHTSLAKRPAPNARPIRDLCSKIYKEDVGIRKDGPNRSQENYDKLSGFHGDLTFRVRSRLLTI